MSTATTKKPRKAVAVIGAGSGYSALLKHLDAISRLGEYKILGQLESVENDNGVIQLGNSGAVIAAGEKAGDLIFLTEFNGLPDLETITARLCPSCSVRCDECQDGTRPCMLAFCVGTGKRTIPLQNQCSCTLSGKAAKRSCRKCKGAGATASVEICPGCHGSKLQPCGLCLGTGKMATGKTVTGDRCTNCSGNGRDVERTPQKLEQFESESPVKKFRAIGEISTIIWRNMVEGGAASKRIVCDILRDDDGKRMTWLVDPASGRQYLMGGHLQPRLL